LLRKQEEIDASLRLAVRVVVNAVSVDRWSAELSVGSVASSYGGDQWKPPFPPNSAYGVNGVAVDSSRARTLYATANLVGPKEQLYRSDDAGEAWRTAGDPVDGTISNLAVDPHNRRVVYASICGRGVQMLTQASTATSSADSDGCAVTGASPNGWMLGSAAVAGALLLVGRRMSMHGGAA